MESRVSPNGRNNLQKTSIADQFEKAKAEQARLRSQANAMRRYEHKAKRLEEKHNNIITWFCMLEHKLSEYEIKAFKQIMKPYKSLKDES